VEQQQNICNSVFTFHSSNLPTTEAKNQNKKVQVNDGANLFSCLFFDCLACCYFYFCLTLTKKRASNKYSVSAILLHMATLHSGVPKLCCSFIWSHWFHFFQPHPLLIAVNGRYGGEQRQIISRGSSG